MTHPNLFSLSQLVYVLERWFFSFYENLVGEFENVVGFVFAWWRHVMTSCHDVKNRRYSISAVEVLERWFFFFCFYSFPACIDQKCYRFCVCMMSWRHDVTKLTVPISACRCSEVMIHIYFCDYFGCRVLSKYGVCTCVMSSCHNVTSWRHLNYYVTSRNELPSSQPADVLVSWFLFVSVISSVAKLNLIIIVIAFAWWNNVTKWRHDVITHAVSISARRRASKIVIFSFYSILGWQVQKYHWFCICICGYVMPWRYDVMEWLYDVT